MRFPMSGYFSVASYPEPGSDEVDPIPLAIIPPLSLHAQQDAIP